MKGININCKDVPYINFILDGSKKIETRNSKSLDPYIGKRIGLIETGKGTAMLCGYATITARFTYDSQKAFDDHYYLHRVPAGSKYDYAGGVKYGYLLENVVPCEPRFIYSKGIVAREI